MRHIMVTPRIKYTFLREALRDLRYASVMERFGIFFLHDLRVRDGVLFLKELPEEDSAEVVQLYGSSLKRPQVSKASQPHRLLQSHETDAYPWGPDPSWTRIQKLLETDPKNFLRKWELAEDWEDPEVFRAELLFIDFTTQLWLSISDHFASSGLLPQPATLKEAMKVWTISEIINVLGADKCRFLPSSHGLKGNLPPNHSSHQSFSAYRRIFFPDLTVEIPDNSIWKPYTRSGRYIETYRNYLKEWDEQSVDLLHHDLDRIFSELQWLPIGISHEKKAKSSIWASTSGKVNCISNPKFYRIREVGKDGPHQRAHVFHRPQASKTILERRLDEKLGVSTHPHVRNRNRKSVKSCRKRRPPVRRRGQRPEDHLGTDEEEEEMEVTDESDRVKGKGKVKKPAVVSLPITRSRAKAAQHSIEMGSDVDQESGGHNLKMTSRVTRSKAKAYGKVSQRREPDTLHSDSDSLR
jgi:hypothetical protein